MPVRRRRTQRVAKRPEAARVLRVTDDGQWHKLLGKLGDRLLLIHFSATWAKPSQMLRPYVAEVARRPQFSHVVFAEIDVDQLSNLAEGMGVKACPTLVCWKHGKLAEKSARGEGGNPATLMAMLDRHAGPKPTKPRWQGLLVKAAIAVAAAAAVGFAVQQRQGQSSEARAAALDDQLQTVKQSLAMAKRRRQAKIVRELQEQLQRLSQERAEINDLLHAATHDANTVHPEASSAIGGIDSNAAASVPAAAGSYSSDEEPPSTHVAVPGSDSDEEYPGPEYDDEDEYSD